MVCVVTEAAKVDGAVGAVVSRASVVILTTLLATETFPAASFAFTVNVYAVAAVSPVTAYDVVVTFAFKTVP